MKIYCKLLKSNKIGLFLLAQTLLFLIISSLNDLRASAVDEDFQSHFEGSCHHIYSIDQLEGLFDQIRQSQDLLTRLDIELDGKRLGRDGAKDLAEKLSPINSLVSLRMSLRFSQIRDIGLIYLSSILKTKSRLKILKLNFYGNKISDSGVHNFASALAGIESLEELSIDLSDNEVGDLSASRLAFSLNHLSKLRTLELYFYGNHYLNHLGRVGVYHISQAVSILSELRILRLSFKSSKIRKNGARAIISAVSKLCNLKCFELDISNNKIKDNEIIEIIELFLKLLQTSRIESFIFKIYQSKAGFNSRDDLMFVVNDYKYKEMQKMVKNIVNYAMDDQIY